MRMLAMRSAVVLTALGALMLGASAPAVSAQERGEPGFACLIERLDAARANCLGLEADRIALDTESLIARATGDLQALDAAEIAAFEASLRRSQARWRREVVRVCRRAAAGDPVAFAECRLQETAARAGEVAAALETARVSLGAPPLEPGPEVPESVEVLIPLPGPPGGPRSRVRVPLEVPVLP